MEKERIYYTGLISSGALRPEAKSRALAMAKNSGILVRGREIPFSWIPLFVNRDDLSFLTLEISRMQEILRKMTRRYVNDPSYRRLFGLSPEMERLICLPCSYEEMIPVGRYDVFLDEETKDFSFCEINTDGAAGMSFDQEISQALLDEMPGREMMEEKFGKMDRFHTIEAMVESLIRIYRSAKNAVPDPVFCVSDFKEEIMMSDAVRFIKAFENRGIKARFTDVRDLTFENGRLTDATDGTEIHGIYRRATTDRIADRIDECQGLIEAAAAEKVVLLGHFRTAVAHSKTIFAAMHHADTLSMLSAEEQAYVRNHVPRTDRLDSAELTEAHMQDYLQNKNDWILKPVQGCASHGVICGADTSPEEWAAVLANAVDQGNIIQKFCKRTPIRLLGPDDPAVSDYYLMLGVFQAEGRAVGFYNRAGKCGLIDYYHQGICTGSIFVDSPVF